MSKDYEVNDRRRFHQMSEDEILQHFDDEKRKVDNDVAKRLIVLLDKMAELHALALYHKDQADKFLAAGMEINQKIVEIVHKRSEIYRPIEHGGNSQSERAPQNIEEILAAMLGRR